MKINASKILKNSHKKTGICHVEIQQVFPCLQSHVNRNVNEKQNLFFGACTRFSKEMFFFQSSSSSLLYKANFSSKFCKQFCVKLFFSNKSKCKKLFFVFITTVTTYFYGTKNIRFLLSSLHDWFKYFRKL